MCFLLTLYDRSSSITGDTARQGGRSRRRGLPLQHPRHLPGSCPRCPGVGDEVHPTATPHSRVPREDSAHNTGQQPERVLGVTLGVGPCLWHRGRGESQGCCQTPCSRWSLAGEQGKPGSQRRMLLMSISLSAILGQTLKVVTIVFHSHYFLYFSCSEFYFLICYMFFFLCCCLSYQCVCIFVCGGRVCDPLRHLLPRGLSGGDGEGRLQEGR